MANRAHFRYPVLTGAAGRCCKEVLRNKFAVFRTERRMHTGVSFLKVQIYFFIIPKKEDLRNYSSRFANPVISV